MADTSVTLYSGESVEVDGEIIVTVDHLDCQKKRVRLKWSRKPPTVTRLDRKAVIDKSTAIAED